MLYFHRSKNTRDSSSTAVINHRGWWHSTRSSNGSLFLSFISVMWCRALQKLFLSDDSNLLIDQTWNENWQHYFPQQTQISQFHVLIKQTQLCLHLPPSDTSPVAPACWWGLRRKWKGADCPKLLLKWLTNHHEPQRLLENHQSIVNHPWFSLPWRSGYRLRWRVWACLCICYFGSRESAGRKGRSSGQK